jgi:ABC-type siderophore export system fused ATPase/permease subunit
MVNSHCAPSCEETPACVQLSYLTCTVQFTQDAFNLTVELLLPKHEMVNWVVKKCSEAVNVCTSLSTMYVREIHIKSFRHLEEVHLGPFILPPTGSDLVVLAGPNGGGKSSILELLG